MADDDKAAPLTANAAPGAAAAVASAAAVTVRPTPTPDASALDDVTRWHLEVPDAGYVWNFAYGSNMNPISLSQRRRIVPVCSLAGVLYDWELRFNQTGLPAVEPVFASVQPARRRVDGGDDGCDADTDDPVAMGGTGAVNAQVHGVLHKMTTDEYAHLLRTEGGAHLKDKRGYRSVPVDVVTYTGHVVRAFTLCTNNRTEGYLPSNRYLTLLRDGARQHGLHPKYQAYLDAFPGYQRGCASTCYLIVMLLLMLPLLLLLGLFSLCGLRYTCLVQRPFRCLADSLWCCFCRPCASAARDSPASYTATDTAPYTTTAGLTIVVKHNGKFVDLPKPKPQPNANANANASSGAGAAN